MFLIGRIAYRARVLSENWVHKNAFTLGLLAGSAVTTVLILAH